MTGWLYEFVHWLASLVPRVGVMRATHRGIRYRRGKHVMVIEPGPYIWWPILTDVESTPISWLPQRLNRQILQTKDGRTVVVGGIAVYRVVDVMKFMVDTWDADALVAEVCLTAIRDVVIEHELERLQSNTRNVIDNRLVREAQAALTEIGVEVKYLKLTDFAPARVMSLVHSQDPQRAFAAANSILNVESVPS